MDPVLVLAVVGLLFVALLLYVVILFNGLVFLKNNIQKAWGNIDVLLKQRHDEVQNLIAVVQGVMRYEQTVLTEVTLARSASLKARSVPEKAAAGEGLSTALGNLFAVAENYPDLKAAENFLALQKRLTALENEIADRREFYNDSVAVFNTRIAQLPDLFVARMMRLAPREFFRVSEEDRGSLSVSLSAR